MVCICKKRTEDIQTKYTFSKYTLKYTFSKYTYSKEVHKGSTQRDNINYERKNDNDSLFVNLSRGVFLAAKLLSSRGSLFSRVCVP